MEIIQGNFLLYTRGQRPPELQQLSRDIRPRLAWSQGFPVLSEKSYFCLTFLYDSWMTQIGSLSSVFTLFSVPYSKHIGLSPFRSSCSEQAWLCLLCVHNSSCAPEDTGRMRRLDLCACLSGGSIPPICLHPQEGEENEWLPAFQCFCYQCGLGQAGRISFYYLEVPGTQCFMSVPSDSCFHLPSLCFLRN